MKWFRQVVRDEQKTVKMLMQIKIEKKRKKKNQKIKIGNICTIKVTDLCVNDVENRVK